MTKRERAQIRKAALLIMDDGSGFHEGVAILATLAGMDYTAARVLRKARPKPVDLRGIEVAHRKASTALENIGNTMRDYDMHPDARQSFRGIRGDLEYCLESIASVRMMIEREEEPAEEPTP